MTTTSIKLLLVDLTTIVKKLGVYEYRFGVTSEEMFSSNKKPELYSLNLSVRNTIQEWQKCYEDYLSKTFEIESINKQKQENDSIPQLNYNEISTEWITNLKRIASERTNKRGEKPKIYEPSKNDRETLIEIRLPLKPSGVIKSLEEGRIELETYSLGVFGKIIKTQKNSNTSYSVLLKCQLNLSKLNKYNIDIVILKNGQYLDLPKSISYQNFDYPIANVSYKLEVNKELWESIEYCKIGQFSDASETEKYFSLSLFISKLHIDESECKIVPLKPHRIPLSSQHNKLEENNLARLEIPIKVEKFCISEGIYWLPEAGEPIDFEWQVDPFSRFGCLGNKIYPVLESRTKYFSAKYTCRKHYDINTPEHHIGNLAVEIVKASLERLVGVTTWQSPPGSDADVKFKWDMFFKFRGKVYPLQIKSSLGNATEALIRYKEEKLPFVPLIIWVVPTDSEEKLLRVIKDIATRFSKIIGTHTSSEISTSINLSDLLISPTKTRTRRIV